MMKMEYDQEADALYIKVKNDKVDHTKEIDLNTILDFNKGGEIIGIEIIGASKIFSGDAKKVIELAKNYGYEVKEIKLPSNIAGFVHINDHIIFVNNSDSETRKAFTIAHELGHIKLHAADLQRNPSLGILYRRPLGRRDDSEKEQEANCFAASLLVPPVMYEEISRQYKGVLTNENKAELLSRIFGVSPEVMRYRLHDFNLDN